MTNYFNAPPDHYKYDTHGTDLDAEPEPVDRCSVCNSELSRVAISVTVDALPYVHLVCSDVCEAELRAQLTEAVTEPCRDTRRAQGEGE